MCGDCGAEDPQWASINWGVVLCIECGGIHRSLGVHITKVRGIRLDQWEPEILKVMAELGNVIVNRVLEAAVGTVYLAAAMIADHHNTGWGAAEAQTRQQQSGEGGVGAGQVPGQAVR